jgi:hypothetical protein
MAFAPGAGGASPDPGADARRGARPAGLVSEIAIFGLPAH